MLNRRHVGVVLAALLVLAGAVPAQAGPRDDRGHGERAERHDQRADRQGRGRGGDERRGYRGREPRERAAEHARRSSRGGRVLSAEPAGDERYRVRVLTPEGYIRNLTVDPRHDD